MLIPEDHVKRRASSLSEEAFLEQDHLGQFSAPALIWCTVKVLNFGTQEIFAVIYLEFKQRGQTFRVFCQNGANGIANSEDPDQTAPLGAV